RRRLTPGGELDSRPRGQRCRHEPVPRPVCRSPERRDSGTAGGGWTVRGRGGIRRGGECASRKLDAAMRSRWAPRSHNAVANDPAARAAPAGEKGAARTGVCYSTLLLGMTGETVFVFAVVGVTILLFLSGRMRLDLVALMALLAVAV